jgi:hypothetical protein
MHDTFASSALHLRLCCSQSLCGRVLVAACDGSFHLLDECPHARLTRLIARSAGLGLPDPLAGGTSIRHMSYCLLETEKPPLLAFQPWGSRSSMHATPASQESRPVRHKMRPGEVTSSSGRVIGPHDMAPCKPEQHAISRANLPAVAVDRLQSLPPLMALRHCISGNRSFRYRWASKRLLPACLSRVDDRAGEEPGVIAYAAMRIG